MITNNKPLRILLDSITLKSGNIQRLLNYSDNDLFEFVSFGESAKHTQLQLLQNSEGEIDRLEIDKSKSPLRGYKETLAFWHRQDAILKISKRLNIKEDELFLLYVLETMSRANDRKTILITERPRLLNPSNQKKDLFPKLFLHNILHSDEALSFIDLHCKKLDTFIVAPNFFVNKGLWYLLSLKTKIDSYQLAWSVSVFEDKSFIYKNELMDSVASLGNRITDMLVAVDEIGQNYYTGANNDTQDGIIYHFNYWITLFTGVLDSLAWISKYRYEIDHTKNTEIGLRKEPHEQFLKKIFEKNSAIKDLLLEKSAMINLIYPPRDLVIHRARLQGILVNNVDENFSLNMVIIQKDFFDLIVTVSKNKGVKSNAWGHRIIGNDYFLEPFCFVKKATIALTDFVDRYLDILNFQDLVAANPSLKNDIDASTNSPNHKELLQLKKMFCENRIGF